MIVCPAHVFGRGDLGPTSTGVVRRFLLRQIPAYVPGAINVVDVEDVAVGHLLADERGVAGERYILGKRNYTWERLFAELERLSGIEGPALELPVGVALALAEAGAHGPFPAPASPAEIRAAGPLVDVQEHEGAPGARLDDPAARGHGRGDRALVRGAPRRPRSRACRVASRRAGGSSPR